MNFVFVWTPGDVLTAIFCGLCLAMVAIIKIHEAYCKWQIKREQRVKK